jgi:hypothetical protein
MFNRQRSSATAAAAFYCAVTAFWARGILAHPATTILSGPGDSLLNASILHWTVTFMQDDNTDTSWECLLAGGDATIDIELGTSTTVGAVAAVVGDPAGFPTELVIETSQDGQSWQPAFSGGVVGDAIRAAIDSPRSPRLVVPFAPRLAKYVRVRHPATRDRTWSVSEIEVWSGGTLRAGSRTDPQRSGAANTARTPR